MTKSIFQNMVHNVKKYGPDALTKIDYIWNCRMCDFNSETKNQLTKQQKNEDKFF